MDPTWSPEAASILERACEAHGGWERWRRLRRISLVPTRLWGLLPRLKGAGRTFPLPARIEVSPHERVTVFHGYPLEGQRGVFERGDVRIESLSDPRAPQSSADHRSTFQGFSKNRRWSPLDALYFFGYALWHYHAVPFTLGEARLVRTERATLDGEALSGLVVRFPDDVPTHSPEQTFYFDRAGCLRRHDYTADVVGSWAMGAHFWNDYQFVEGVPIASARHVRPRVLGRVLPLTVLRATFVDIHVELDVDGGPRSA